MSSDEKKVFSVDVGDMPTEKVKKHLDDLISSKKESSSGMIKLIKLVTGEDLMAEVIRETETTMTLKNPIRIIVIPGRQNDPKGPTVGFAPWQEFADNNECEIKKHHVITTAAPIVEFLNNYKATFGGIVVPQAKLIMPS